MHFWVGDSVAGRRKRRHELQHLLAAWLVGYPYSRMVRVLHSHAKGSGTIPPSDCLDSVTSFSNFFFHAACCSPCLLSITRAVTSFLPTAVQVYIFSYWHFSLTIDVPLWQFVSLPSLGTSALCLYTLARFSAFCTMIWLFLITFFLQ